MTNYIKIGGKERPIGFGFHVGLEYEIQTGKNYNALVYGILGQAEQTRDRYLAGDLAGAANAMSLLPMTTVVYYGLRFGCHQESVEVDFELSDVANWVFSDQHVMEQCLTLLFESLPRPSGEQINAAAKKKTTTSRSGSIGKTSSKRLRH